MACLMMVAKMVTRTTPGRTRKFLLASKAMHGICKLFGLMPFTVDVRTASLVTSRLDSVILTLAFSAQLVSACTYPYLFSLSLDKFSVVEIIVFIVALNHAVLSLVSVVSDACFNRKKYENMVQLIATCDRILAVCTKRDGSGGEKFIKLQVLLFLLFFCLMVAFVLTSRSEPSFRLGEILNLYVYGTSLLTVMRFSNLQLAIRQRIADLNFCILEMRGRCRVPAISVGEAASGKQPNGSHGGARCTPERVRSLRRLYSALCQLSAVVASAHANFLILYFLAMSATTVIQLYLSFTNALFIGVDLNEAQSQFRAGMLVHLCSLAFTVVPAHCVEAEAGRTRVLCCRLLAEGRRVGGCGGGCGGGGHRELRRLAAQASAWRPRARLAGVLTLRVGLVATFISVVTTYTALMITFLPKDAKQSQS